MVSGLPMREPKKKNDGKVCFFFGFFFRLVEKRRDIVFGFPSYRPSVCPSFRPPIVVCTLCAQRLLQYYCYSSETLQMS